MSFLLPNDQMWGVANWVSRGFFADAEQLLERAPSLADDVRFCINTDLDTLDLQEADLGTLQELKVLVYGVLANNRENGGSDFHDPTMFPVYLEHLEQLSNLVDAAVEYRANRSHPAGPT